MRCGQRCAGHYRRTSDLDASTRVPRQHAWHWLHTVVSDCSASGAGAFVTRSVQAAHQYVRNALVAGVRTAAAGVLNHARTCCDAVPCPHGSLTVAFGPLQFQQFVQASWSSTAAVFRSGTKQLATLNAASADSWKPLRTVFSSQGSVDITNCKIPEDSWRIFQYPPAPALRSTARPQSAMGPAWKSQQRIQW
jgi:hypothetical protein